MPRRDGTGPMGIGPASGRGLGGCTGVNAPATGWGYGAGFRAGYGGGGMRLRCGLGAGRGGRWAGGWGLPFAGAAFAPSPQDEQQALQNQARILEAELKAIQRRMAELDQRDAE